MPDFVAKQSTATTVVAGPFRDVTNAATKLTALTITPSDVQIRKEGSGSFGAKSEASNATHMADGYYLITFNTTDMNTKGTLFGQIDMTGAFPVDFTVDVIAPDEWERKYGTGTSTQDLLAAIQKLHDYPVLETTIDTRIDDDRWMMVDGVNRNDAYNGFICVVESALDSTKFAARVVEDYTGADKTLYLFQQVWSPVASGDIIRLYYPSAANIARWLDLTPLELTSSLVRTQSDQFGTSSQTSLNTLGTQIRGADSDTLKTLSDQLDAFSVGTTPFLLQNTTIATLTSQTVFTLTAGSDDNDAYRNGTVVFTDQSTPTQKSFVQIASYSGATKTITLTEAPKFTIAVGDTVDILASTVDNSQLTDIENKVITIENLSSSTNTRVLALPDNGSLSTITSGVASILEDTADIQPKMGTFVSFGSGANLSANLQDLSGSLIDPGLGGGPHTVTLTFIDSDTSDPIENLAVRMKASASDDLRGVTDANGQVTFYCQDATYTITARIANYTLDDSPLTLVVSGDATPTAYTMTAVSVTPSLPGFTTGYLTVLDEDGAPESGIIITLSIKQPPENDMGYAYDTKRRSQTSDVNGLVEFIGMIPGATYMITREDSLRSGLFTVASDAGPTYAINSFVGRD